MYPIITFFIQPFPEITQKSLISNLLAGSRKPGSISRKILKNKYLSHYSTEGILSTYAGYLTASDLDGQITFARKHAEPKFYILITQAINPVIMLGSTIHHWELNRHLPAHLFSVERMYDQQTNTYFWNVQKAQLPDNNIIALNTIIIFAHPKNIYVPLGISITSGSSQLYLPDIYAKSTINIAQQALWMLTVRHFFGPVGSITKKQSDTYYSTQLHERS